MNHNDESSGKATTKSATSNGHKANGYHDHTEEAKETNNTNTNSNISNDIIQEMTELLDKLEASNCLVDVREGLQTFLIYVSNIIKHPLEAKYRKIRVGNANYQVRLGHLKHGAALLKCIGYKVDSTDFLILPSSLYTTSGDLFIIKRIRDLTVYRLEKITSKFRLVPRQHELASHKWSCCKHAVEAHTIGRRPAMEDDHILLDTYCNKSYLGFFGLYDGHGGRATVDFLTCSFYLNLQHYLALNKNLAMSKALDDVYSITDKQIHRQQIYQSGATSVTLVLDQKNRHFTVANCGDTRAVLCRKGKAIRLTKDHKADDAEEAAMIRKRGGTIGRLKRVNGLLAVTRAFGDHLLKPPITVKPTIVDMQLTDDDHFIVLACDGVWDVLQDEEVVHYVYTQILKKSNQKSYQDCTQQHLQKCLHQICLDIVKNALDRRSQDNISCMIIAL
mmetsp:Transcript_69961/g.111271  ORF Transcript_69961/g.111271 Transcript_69961/m.111271 type:complete len:447 (+) Transcript_69961:195-1535(+)